MTDIILRGAIDSKCEHEYINMGYVYIHQENTTWMIYDFDNIPVEERKNFLLYKYFLCNHCLLRRYTLEELK